MRKPILKTWLNNRFQEWATRNIPPTKKIVLNRRNIFILPTGNGLMFIGAAMIIFLAAINYEINLAFGLALLMLSIFVVTILYSYNNLNKLQITSMPSSAVFCGDDAGFQILLSRLPTRSHESLELAFPDSTVTRVDVFKQDQETVSVYTRAEKRGEFIAPRLIVTSFFPLGLLRAWSVVDMNLKCLVYPKPVNVPMRQISNSVVESENSSVTREGSEDFYGLREYSPGDSMKQVSWKNVARGQGMQVKQFIEYVDERIWLDWDMFYGFAMEERLSRLCFCVLQLTRANVAYGLKLPGFELQPGKGNDQRIRALTALARYPNTASIRHIQTPTEAAA